MQVNSLLKFPLEEMIIWQENGHYKNTRSILRVCNFKKLQYLNQPLAAFAPTIPTCINEDFFSESLYKKDVEMTNFLQNEKSYYSYQSLAFKLQRRPAKCMLGKVI